MITNAENFTKIQKTRNVSLKLFIFCKNITYLIRALLQTSTDFSPPPYCNEMDDGEKIPRI